MSKVFACLLAIVVFFSLISNVYANNKAPTSIPSTLEGLATYLDENFKERIIRGAQSDGVYLYDLTQIKFQKLVDRFFLSELPISDWWVDQIPRHCSPGKTLQWNQGGDVSLVVCGGGEFPTINIARYREKFSAAWVGEGIHTRYTGDEVGDAIENLFRSKKYLPANLDEMVEAYSGKVNPNLIREVSLMFPKFHIRVPATKGSGDLAKVKKQMLNLLVIFHEVYFLFWDKDFSKMTIEEAFKLITAPLPQRKMSRDPSDIYEFVAVSPSGEEKWGIKGERKFWDNYSNIPLKVIPYHLVGEFWVKKGGIRLRIEKPYSYLSLEEIAQVAENAQLPALLPEFVKAKVREWIRSNLKKHWLQIIGQEEIPAQFRQ